LCYGRTDEPPYKNGGSSSCLRNAACESRLYADAGENSRSPRAYGERSNGSRQGRESEIQSRCPQSLHRHPTRSRMAPLAQTEMSLSTVSVRGIGPMTVKRALGYFLSVASARATALTNLWRSNSPVAVCQCSFAGNNKSRLFIRKQQVLAISNVLGLAFMERAFTIRLRRRAKRGT
jgi:hypothetical protein